jgi:hypothetical protein
VDAFGLEEQWKDETSTSSTILPCTNGVEIPCPTAHENEGSKRQFSHASSHDFDENMSLIHEIIERVEWHRHR